jgi:RNA polymerase sigma-70 factor, ECF subfamily
MMVAGSTENSPDARRNSSQPAWAELVDKVKQNDAIGLEELYRVFSWGVRFYLCKKLGPQDLDDRVHDTFLTVTQAIQRGDLREPERLMGYVRTIVRRQVAAQIEENVHNRKHQIDLDWDFIVHEAGRNPEQTAIQRQNEDIARKVLKSVAPRDREVLIRFYMEEQPAKQICNEMGISVTQFKLLKSRAKARFAELGKRRIAGHLVPFGENWWRLITLKGWRKS